MSRLLGTIGTLRPDSTFRSKFQICREYCNSTHHFISSPVTFNHNRYRHQRSFSSSSPSPTVLQPTVQRPRPRSRPHQRTSFPTPFCIHRYSALANCAMQVVLQRLQPPSFTLHTKTLLFFKDTNIPRPNCGSSNSLHLPQ